MEIQSHEHHHWNRRMGQHTPRILSLVRNLKFEGYQALARRRKMARARLDLLARHAAVLFVNRGLIFHVFTRAPALARWPSWNFRRPRVLAVLPVQFLSPRALSAPLCAKVLRGPCRRC